MTEDQRNEICEEMFKSLVDKTGGKAGEMIIIAKKMLIGIVHSVSRTDGVTPEMTNRTFEILAHELLSWGLMEFSEPTAILTLNNN